MKNQETQAAPRRRQRYVDRRIQGRLTVALVLLEVALFGGACLYLYFALAGLIDANLYVIHAAAREDLLVQMARELGWVVLVCGIVNSAALLFTHGLWSRHVSRVLAALHRRMERVRALDLRPDPAALTEGESHRLIELCDEWIAFERQRMLAINAALARLPKAPPLADGTRHAGDAQAALEEALGCLRPQSTASSGADDTGRARGSRAAGASPDA